MTTFDPAQPVYRYYVADLMTNSVLAEIPFTGVTYDRALKGAGTFSGQVAVLDDTVAANLYDYTVPGKTSLYIVRNNVCVWGGIIWGRSYSITEKVLNVSGSEFTSYLYHRNIWKTYSHDFAGTTVVDALGNATTTLTFGSFNFVPGSTIAVEFYEVGNFQYSGYYTVLSLGLSSTTVAVSIPGMPAGTYDNTTVRVRVDTYDYVRQLLDQMNIDFSGIQFPNGEIEPTLTLDYDITTKSLTSNVATLTTSTAHNMIPGQSVLVKNVDSTFDGTHTVVSKTDTTFSYAKTASNVGSTAVSVVSRTVSQKEMSENVATLTTSVAHGFSVGQTVDIENVDSLTSDYVIFNGTHTITSVPSSTTFTYSVFSFEPNVDATAVSGTATLTPRALSSTYGPYPANADIGIEYSTAAYSGVNVPNVTYRGYELRSVGEELDEYSDTVDGFEYRIDCEYDSATGTFKRTFVLLPINFPNPPPAGEAAPLSRYGADQFVFEYPGNVNEVSISESAENSATRFFVVGNIGDLGSDASQPYAVAADTGLLDAGWPLLDMEETRGEAYDENILYSYASRYLAEFRPPLTDMSITVNGSLDPTVGTYSPGDWCALIVDDPFIQRRLLSNLEPRDDIIVRKIEGFSVTVPDGNTFPETVQLQLVAESEVDKIGE
jgi:hypothetical protein